VRISEKEGKELLKLPLGLVFETKGNFEINLSLSKAKKPQLEAIHGKATYYKVVSGKVVAYGLKTEKGA